jgi:CRISPR-associated endonuclease Cas3-HD
MVCSAGNNPMWLQWWGKTPREKPNQRCEDGRYHPLLYHMLDVAAVAGLVWDQCLIPQLRERLECSLGGEARGEIVFLAGAHDVGKGSPWFQKKVPVLIRDSSLRFSESDQSRPHGFISAHVLNEVLESWSDAALLGKIIGGHHGVFPRATDLRIPHTRGGEPSTSWSRRRTRLYSPHAWG